MFYPFGPWPCQRPNFLTAHNMVLFLKENLIMVFWPAGSGGGENAWMFQTRNHSHVLCNFYTFGLPFMLVFSLNFRNEVFWSVGDKYSWLNIADKTLHNLYWTGLQISAMITTVIKSQMSYYLVIRFRMVNWWWQWWLIYLKVPKP